MPNQPIDLTEYERSLYEFSYYDFMKRAFQELHQGEEIIDNWHLEEICFLLQERVEVMLEGKPGKHLIINIPPRSLKSIMVSVCLLPWIWTQDQSIKLISSSYSSSLSMDHNVMTRRLVESDWYLSLWGDKVRMAGDQNEKRYFENTFSGSRRSTSTGGSITGKGGDIIVIDDPVDPTGAASEVERIGANEYFQKTLSTRLNKPDIGFFIVVMQRLHELDLTGHLLETNADKWEHYCLPGETSSDIKPASFAEKYKKGLMFPERFTADVLGQYQINLGSYGYAGQIQQSPSPEGGGIWKQWFVPLEDKHFPDIPRMKNYGTDWDLAYTEKQDNSASAFVTSGKIDGNMYIDKIGYVNLEFPNLIKFMASIPSPHHIEGMASGKSAKQTLLAMGITAIEVAVTGGDKIARANMATPHAEAGQIFIRKGLLDKLYNDSNQGILRFPNGRQDDLADALSQSVQRHFKKREIWGV